MQKITKDKKKLFFPPIEQINKLPSNICHIKKKKKYRKRNKRKQQENGCHLLLICSVYDIMSDSFYCCFSTRFSCLTLIKYCYVELFINIFF